MEKPKWLCGSADSWERMKPGMEWLSLSGKLRSNLKLNIAGEAVIGALVSVGVGFLMNPGAGGLVGAAALAFLMGSAIDSEKGDSLSSSIAEAVGMSKLKVLAGERLEDLEELSKVVESAGVNASTPYAVRLTEGLKEATERAIAKKKQIRWELSEEERMAEAAILSNPKAFAKNEGWRPTDIEFRLGALGSIAADGVAAASMAAALLKEKNMDDQSRSELTHVTGVLLPRLADSFERVPEEERENRLAELKKSPREAFEEGMAAAMERVLKVRATLTARAKVEVEAEKNVLKSGL